MSDLTGILSQMSPGGSATAEELLPLVYKQLRELAAAQLIGEPGGQTLQATALVHEAYLRLVKQDPNSPKWHNRGHFFAAAAEAMRRILIENARHKRRDRHGGGRTRLDLDLAQVADDGNADELLKLDEALDRLSQADPEAARLVKLRFFCGLSIREVATVMESSPRSTDRLWAYARAWLYRDLYGP